MANLKDLLPPHWIRPEYGGRCLTALPSTVGSLLAPSEAWPSPPLRLDAEINGVKRIVVLLLDGLGHALLERLHGDPGSRLPALLQRHGGNGELPAPITSVSPSTTSVATSVIHAGGATPGELGLLGYSQLLPRLGVIANMLFFTPAYGPGNLEAWGAKPEQFLETPSTYQLLGRAAVESFVFMPSDIARSPLSRMQYRGASVNGYVNYVDLFNQLALHLESAPPAPSYTFAYVPDLDTIMHVRGPEDRAVTRAYAAIESEVERLLATLTPAARDGTLLLITADHGLLSSPVHAQTLLDQHPNLLAAMTLREAGEPRHAYLYARAGAARELFEAAQRELSREFVVLKGEDALAAGLYGDPRSLHPEAHLRIGDVILLARGGATLWSSDTRRPLLGMHGALEREEMLVPLLALRADA